jgi:hypothetical protein
VIYMRRFGCWGNGLDRGKPRVTNTALEKRCNPFAVSDNPATRFRKHYERGDLPVVIRHGARLVLEWKAPIHSLAIAQLLPIFVDGIREKHNPYRFVATEGAFNLITCGEPERISGCVDELVHPIKCALDTHDPSTVILALKVLQGLSKTSPDVALALVAHYRQLLPTLNLFKAQRRNLGDRMDYAQFKQDKRNLGPVIEETLTVLERTGGPDAFSQIKFIVPTYETCSVFHNRDRFATPSFASETPSCASERNEVCEVVHGHYDSNRPYSHVSTELDLH